jgi:hypothetical protein
VAARFGELGSKQRSKPLYRAPVGTLEGGDCPKIAAFPPYIWAGVERQFLRISPDLGLSTGKTTVQKNKYRGIDTKIEPVGVSRLLVLFGVRLGEDST